MLRFMCIFLEVSNETSAYSGCSCVHNDFDIFNICSHFPGWCKVVSGTTTTLVGDCALSNSIYIHFCVRVTAVLLNQLEHNCGLRQLADLKSCDPYSCSASPVTPAAAVLTGNDTVFVYNYHAFSCQRGLIIPGLLCVPNMNSRQEECNITAARS